MEAEQVNDGALAATGAPPQPQYLDEILAQYPDTDVIDDYVYWYTDYGRVRQQFIPATGQLVGEIEEEKHAWLKRGKRLSSYDPTKKKDKKLFTRVFHEPYEDLHEKLNWKERGIMLQLAMLMGYESPVIINPETRIAMNTSELAEYIGVDRKYMGQVLKKLQQLGVISPVGNSERQIKTYQFNPAVCIFGFKIKDELLLSQFERYGYH